MSKLRAFIDGPAGIPTPSSFPASVGPQIESWGECLWQKQ
jgi:hypothetical protein